MNQIIKIINASLYEIPDIKIVKSSPASRIIYQRSHQNIFRYCEIIYGPTGATIYTYNTTETHINYNDPELLKKVMQKIQEFITNDTKLHTIDF